MFAINSNIAFGAEWRMTALGRQCIRLSSSMVLLQLTWAMLAAMDYNDVRVMIRNLRGINTTQSWLICDPTSKECWYGGSVNKCQRKCIFLSHAIMTS